jgi:uncharacterized protein (TIGR00159 family)
MIGNRYLASSRFSFENFFYHEAERPGSHRETEEIVRAAESMASKKTGALIVIGRTSSLDSYAESGEIMNARISSDLLETIFFKNSPLHDGAVLIEAGVILAARCTLPITDQISVPSHFGMRHRAAIGITEQVDSMALVISEETGFISVADNGTVRENITPHELRQILIKQKT